MLAGFLGSTSTACAFSIAQPATRKLQYTHGPRLPCPHAAVLKQLEADGRIMMDGGEFWVSY